MGFSPDRHRRALASGRRLAVPATLALALATAACGDDRDEPTGSAGSGGTTATGSGTTTSTGTTTGTSSGTTTGGSGGTTGGGGADTGYPAPPYGNQVGEVMPLLLWEGYINPNADAVATTQPYVDWSTDDVRTSGVSHALVHLAAVF